MERDTKTQTARQTARQTSKQLECEPEATRHHAKSFSMKLVSNLRSNRRGASGTPKSSSSTRARSKQHASVTRSLGIKSIAKRRSSHRGDQRCMSGAPTSTRESSKQWGRVLGHDVDLETAPQPSRRPARHAQLAEVHELHATPRNLAVDRQTGRQAGMQAARQVQRMSKRKSSSCRDMSVSTWKSPSPLPPPGKHVEREPKSHERVRGIAAQPAGATW